MEDEYVSAHYRKSFAFLASFVLIMTYSFFSCIVVFIIMEAKGQLER